MMARNPYSAGPSVGGTQAFVGRETLIEEVVRMLRHPQRNALLVYGGRAAGKSSLLAQLAARVPDLQSCYAVHMDLDGWARRSTGELLQELAHAIARSLGLSPPSWPEQPEVEFERRWFPSLLDRLPQGSSLLLLFDEFEPLDRPELDRVAGDFYSLLRPWIGREQRRLGFVFALGRNSDDLVERVPALFRGIPLLRLEAFTLSELESLLQLSERAPVGPHWTSEALSSLARWTGGQPFLAQLLAALCWDAWQEAGGERLALPIGRELVDAQLHRAVERATPTLEWIWKGLGRGARLTASFLAHHRDELVPREALLDWLREASVRGAVQDLDGALDQLKQWDLVVPSEEGFRFRSPLLRRWIVENKPHPKLRISADPRLSRAERYYQAALSLWEDLSESPDQEDFGPILALLDRTLRANPSHEGATALLADIHLARGDEDRAVQLLEGLLERDPEAARRRLVPLLLERAARAPDEDARLDAYEHVLGIAPGHDEAIRARRAILEGRAQRSRQAGDIERAIYWYELAGLEERAAELRRELQRRELEHRAQEISEKLRQRDFDAARRALDEARRLFPEAEAWKGLAEELDRQERLHELFERGTAALREGRTTDAQHLLAQLVALDPTYPGAVRVLYQAVTGTDPEEPTRDLPPFPPGLQGQSPAPGEQRAPASPAPAEPAPVPAPVSPAGPAPEASPAGPAPEAPRDAGPQVARTEPAAPPRPEPARVQLGHSPPPTPVPPSPEERLRRAEDRVEQALSSDAIPLGPPEEPSPPPSPPAPEDKPDADIWGGWAEEEDEWIYRQRRNPLTSPWFWLGAAAAALLALVLWRTVGPPGGTPEEAVPSQGATAREATHRAEAREEQPDQASGEEAPASMESPAPGASGSEEPAGQPEATEAGTEPARQGERAGEPSPAATSETPAHPVKAASQAKKSRKPRRSSRQGQARVPLPHPGPVVMGKLDVQTEPPGATVYVDGSRAGVTPLSGYDLPSGDHVLRFVMDGYQDMSLLVTIKGGDSTNLGTIGLDPAP